MLKAQPWGRPEREKNGRPRDSDLHSGHDNRARIVLLRLPLRRSLEAARDWRVRANIDVDVGGTVAEEEIAPVIETGRADRDCSTTPKNSRLLRPMRCVGIPVAVRPVEDAARHHAEKRASTICGVR